MEPGVVEHIRRLRQEDHLESQASMGYRARPCIKKQIKTGTNKKAMW